MHREEGGLDMNRKQRTEMLINGSPQLAAALANEIESRYPVALIEEPNHGLVMVKVRETAQKACFTWARCW